MSPRDVHISSLDTQQRPCLTVMPPFKATVMLIRPSPGLYFSSRGVDFVAGAIDELFQEPARGPHEYGT
jgi:hypothetical protein